MSLLALDFDGVIWDSVDECYEMARRAYGALYGTIERDFKERFRQARWLARTGHDFYVVLRIMQEQPQLDFRTISKESFLARKDELGAQVQQFDTEFYRQRAALRDHDLDAWLRLQRPYPEVIETLPRLRRAFDDVVIATTKDELSVHRLLGSVGVELEVCGKGFSTDKARQINHLAESRGLTADQVVFVDDLLDNLLSVRPTGARVALAGWGYNTPAEQQQTRTLGMPVLDLERLELELEAVSA